MPHCQVPALFWIPKILSPSLRYLDVWSCYKLFLVLFNVHFTHFSLVGHCAVGLYQCYNNALWCQCYLIDKCPRVFCASLKLLGFCYRWCIGRVKKFHILFSIGTPSSRWLWSSQIMKDIDTLKQHCIGYWPPSSASWCMGQFPSTLCTLFGTPIQNTLGSFWVLESYLVLFMLIYGGNFDPPSAIRILLRQADT